MSEYIDKLKQIPLTDILQNIYNIELHQRGDKYYCKIRDEKTSSCHIYPNNTFYDFGSGVGGDAINLVEALDGCDRKTAMEKLSQLYNINRGKVQRDRKILLDYEWKKLGIVPDMVSKNLNINIIEHEGQWKRSADINLNPENTEQIKLFQSKYQVPVSEFRKADSAGYHNFLREKIYFPLIDEKDQYLSQLYNQYRLMCELVDKKTAFSITVTDPETVMKAAEIEAKFPLLQNAVDDISLLKVPTIHLNPQQDLQNILDGTAKFKVSKLPYFELCKYAKILGELLCTVTVSYDAYLDVHTPNNSELRGIPHYSFYQNEQCKLYCMAKDYDKINALFDGEIINSKRFSKPYAQEKQQKSQQKAYKNFSI